MSFFFNFHVLAIVFQGFPSLVSAFESGFQSSVLFLA
jgi:hypothetical protein